MAKITLEIEEWSGDCETCGPWHGDRLLVLKDDAIMLDMSGDGHMGGAAPSDQPYEHVIKRVLESLGYSVEITYR